MRLDRLIRVIFLVSLLAGCKPAPTGNAASPVPTTLPTAAAETAEPAPTNRPTATPRPSPTPRPTPMLPVGPDFACLPTEGPRAGAVVAGVIDGDTIKVQIGVQSFTVRYIGINSPETNVQPPERMGPEATSRNRELVSGERAILVGDPETGDTDRYGRLLRYVIVGEVFVNAQLVREGLARYYAGESACGSLIFAAEEEARAAHVGLWSPLP